VRERPSTLSEQIERRVTGWHGTRLHQPDWNDDSHSLAVGVQLPDRGVRLHVIFNAYWEPLDFQLPPVGDGAHWRRWLDTACESPDDVVDWECSPPVRGSSYRAEARSSVVLWSPMSRD